MITERVYGLRYELPADLTPVPEITPITPTAPAAPTPAAEPTPVTRLLRPWILHDILAIRRKWLVGPPLRLPACAWRSSNGRVPVLTPYRLVGRRTVDLLVLAQLAS